jgi:uncharacterized membrane protein YjjP (DUF1212 family)
MSNHAMPPDVVMLIAVMAFFIVVDNSLKVAFLQPYPGMSMFLLWGILLGRLRLVATHEGRVK